MDDKKPGAAAARKKTQNSRKMRLEELDLNDLLSPHERRPYYSNKKKDEEPVAGTIQDGTSSTPDFPGHGNIEQAGIPDHTENISTTPDTRPFDTASSGTADPTQAFPAGNLSGNESASKLLMETDDKRFQEYLDTFMAPTDRSRQRILYVDEELHGKIFLLVYILGRGKYSVVNYLNNILLHHFEQYHEEYRYWIEKMYQEVKK